MLTHLTFNDFTEMRLECAKKVLPMSFVSFDDLFSRVLKFLSVDRSVGQLMSQLSRGQGVSFVIAPAHLVSSFDIMHLIIPMWLCSLKRNIISNRLVQIQVIFRHGVRTSWDLWPKSKEEKPVWEKHLTDLHPDITLPEFQVRDVVTNEVGQL